MRFKPFPLLQLGVILTLAFSAFGEENWYHFRGAGSSILVWNGLLFLPFDGSDYQYVVALDKKTGQTVWKTNRSIDFKDIQPNGRPQGDGDFRKAFSTPRIAEFPGQAPVL